MEFVDVMKIEERICDYYGRTRCMECLLGKANNGKRVDCPTFITKYPEEAQEIMMKWAEEHPIKTNGSKFLEDYPNLEVSGYRANGDILFIRLDKSEPYVKRNCIEVPAEWWNKEYEEVK